MSHQIAAVIPAKAGVQLSATLPKKLDSGLTSSAVESRRNDEKKWTE
jgi:hypothetical protein